MTISGCRRFAPAARLLGRAVLVLALPAAAVGGLVPTGSEFQVNAYTVGYQSIGYGPQLGASATGEFVVVWQDLPGYSISARRFDSSGAPVGTDLQVRADVSYRPALAVAPGGEFTVAWEAADGGFYGVLARRFSSAGSALGTEFRVNTYVPQDQGFHDMAADGAGNVLIAWESNGQDGRARGVFAQAYDGTGAALGSELQVNSYTAGSEAGAVVAGDPAGGFAVAWSDYRFDGVLPIFFARRYDGSGNPDGQEFQVNSYTMCFNGKFALSVGPSGSLVAAWGCRDRDGDSSGIFAQRFASSGVPVGTDFQVNTHTVYIQTDPAIAHDANGGFTVTWQSDHGTNNFNVFGQRYTSAGTPSGPEFQVNTYTLLLQAYSEIAALPGGDFVVVWTSNGQDGDLFGVFGQRLAAGGIPLPSKKLLIKTPGSGPAKNKLVLLSRDPAVATPGNVAEDPRCPPLGSGSPAAGGRLRVTGEGGDFSIDLPCAAWVANADRTKFTYRDATGATCRRVLIKDGRLLKAVCKGAQVAYALGTPQGSVSVQLTLGDPGSPIGHCAVFAAATSAQVVRDGSDGRVYKAFDAEGLSFCP